MEIELISKTVKGGIARDKDGNPIKCPKELLPLTDEELANTKFELIDVSGASEEDYEELNDMLKAEIEKQTNASWEDIVTEETSSILTPEETIKLAMKIYEKLPSRQIEPVAFEDIPKKIESLLKRVTGKNVKIEGDGFNSGISAIVKEKL